MNTRESINDVSTSRSSVCDDIYARNRNANANGVVEQTGPLVLPWLKFSGRYRERLEPTPREGEELRCVGDMLSLLRWHDRYQSLNAT